MLIPNRSSEDLDLDDVLQGIGFALLVAFLAIIAKLAFPVALVQPGWQLRVGESLRATASIPLVAMALLLLAEFINPDSQILANRILWLRRLSVVAALGFFLLIPLQISAGLREITKATVLEYRELSAIQRASTAIQEAVTQREMFNAIKLIPGLPPDATPAFNLPIPAIRTALLAQIRPQILKLETRIREVRSQRIQGAITIFAFDAFLSLAYGIGFAAIGRTSVQRPTLLRKIITIPSYLQRNTGFFGEALLSLPRVRLPFLPASRSRGGGPSSQSRSSSRHRRSTGSRRSSGRTDIIPEEWLDEPDQDSGRRS